MNYTRKDFEFMAAEIRQLPASKREALIRRWVGRYKESNPKFNEDQFRIACGEKVQVGLPKTVLFQTLVTVHLTDLLNWKLLGKTINKLKVNDTSYDFTKLVRQARYSANHQWAGQVQGSWVNVREIYPEIFGAEHRIGTHRDWDGAVCAGSQSMDVCDYLLDCLFQVEHAEETEACSNLMGPWIQFTVDNDKVDKFSASLARHLSVISTMKFSLRKY